MRNIFLQLNNEKGIALIISFLVITALLIYLAAFISISINQNISADIFKRRMAAFNLADAGLDHAVTYLRAQPSPPIGGPWTDPWAGGIQNTGGGTYSVTITDLGIVGATGNIRRYRITSTGSFRNINRILTNYVQVDNFARYIWFTNSETFGGTNVWFWTPDYLNGETHTNTHFNIYGNPVFAGDAHSVDNYIRFYNNGSPVNLSQATNPPNDIPDFQQGMQFGVQPTVMPAQATNLRSAALSGGMLLAGDTTVVLNANGTMDLTNFDYCNNPLNDCDDAPLPANGALFVNCAGRRCRDGGSLTISGTLDGSLTVGAERDIIIPNNVVYANDPRIDPNSNDVLGMIAEDDIMITNNAPSDLSIFGCMMAMDSSFYRDNWQTGLKGTLTVYGGIIQDERGPIGTFSSNPPPNGTKISGYDKNYSYDSRFLTNPPPFMPTTGDYVTLSWEED